MKLPIRARFGKISIFVSLLTLLSACSASPPSDLGVHSDGMLASCPSSPNCVSSFASPSDKTHFIEPLHVNKRGWAALQTYLKKQPQFKIVVHKGNYIHADATTRIMHFVDDVEFLYQPARHLIQVRSASRVGYSDFGKNRSRIEHLRKALSNEGVLIKGQS